MSHLQLERHFFTKVELKPYPNGKAKAFVRIACHVNVGQDVTDPKHYQVTLTVEFGKNPEEKKRRQEKNPYYTGTIEVVGLFRVHPEYKENPERLVHISGTSLLYGAVRELVCTLTARGPWPMVVLSTMAFSPPNGNLQTAVEKEVGIEKPPKVSR